MVDIAVDTLFVELDTDKLEDFVEDSLGLRFQVCLSQVVLQVRVVYLRIKTVHKLDQGFMDLLIRVPLDQLESSFQTVWFVDPLTGLFIFVSLEILNLLLIKGM